MPHRSRLASALALALLTATTVHAQRAPIPAPSLKPAPAAVAMQSAPNPAGLQSPVPAGLTSGSGAAVSTNPNIAGSSTITGVGSSQPGSDMAAAAAATATLGAGGSRGPSQYLGSGGLGFSAVDIARSFITADVNRDGELTEGEARRLSISMQSFQEMDRNFDGVVSRSEYEDSLR